VMSHKLLTREEEREASRDELVMHNLRLARSRVARWEGSGVDREDLEQQAVIGLLTAADKFDPSQGVRFSTYAVPWIDNELRRTVQKALQVRLPIYVQQEGDTPAPTFKEAGTPGEAGVLDPVDFNTPGPEEGTILNLWRKRVQSRLPILSNTQAEVLVDVFGLNGSPPKSIAEVARNRGVSRARVSRIVSTAKETLAGS